MTPWGDLYPCHQFVGDEKYLLGNVWDGVTNTELRDEFKLCNAYARPDCKDCWGPPVLQRRLCGQRVPCHRQHQGRV